MDWLQRSPTVSPASLTATWKNIIPPTASSFRANAQFSSPPPKPIFTREVLVKINRWVPFIGEAAASRWEIQIVLLFMFSQMHCLIAIIKSLGHKEAGLIDPPQAHVQNSALLWLY